VLETDKSKLDPVLPEDRRSSHRFWQKWLKAAQKAAKGHWDDSRDAWGEYENARSSTVREAGSGERQGPQRYPIYWNACKTIEPAYYARTPKIVAKRLFDIEDPISALICEIVEHVGKSCIEGCDFDDVMSAAVQDFIHADKATTQVIYTAKTTTEKKRKPLTMADDGAYMNGDGAHEGDVFEDDEGAYYEADEQHAEDQCLKLSPCCYNEVLHTPDAKVESEITEKAYYFRLEEDEVKERFPDVDLTRIPWKRAKSGDDEESRRDDEQSTGRYLEGWECYSLKTKKVYCVAEKYDGFLKEPEDDPYKLKRFFPSPPFIIGSKPSKSMYPTPEWIHLRATADQLQVMYERVFSLIKQVRRRAIVSEESEIIEALQSLDNAEFITAKNMQSIVEKGGLSTLVQYLPVSELVSAISELNALDDKFKANFYEWKGIPDIMRGQGDPVETAAAQEMQQGNAHDRFKYQKKLVQRLARDSVEMLVDLALQVYADEKIAEICGYLYMPPEKQQLFWQALASARNDRERILRIEIETDSTSFADERAERAKADQTGKLVMECLNTVTQMIKQEAPPEFVMIALRTMLATLDRIQQGKEFEPELKAAVNKVMQQAMEPKPPAPPPPDYEALKLEMKQQELASKEKLAVMAADLKSMELDLKNKKIDADSMDENVRAQIQQAALAMKERLESAWQQIDQLKIMINAQQTAQATAATRPNVIMMSSDGKMSKKLGGTSSEGAEPDAVPIRTKKVFTPIRDEAGEILQLEMEEIPVL